MWAASACTASISASGKAWDDKYNGGKNSGGASTALVVIVIVVGLFAFIFIIGILAAVAIPAYQDYTRRAQISMAFSELSSHKAQFEALVATRDLAKRLDEAGIAVKATPQTYLSGAYYDPARLVLVGKLAGGSAGRSIGLKLNSDATWTCGSVDLEKKYLPGACRGELAYADEVESAKMQGRDKSSAPEIDTLRTRRISA